MKTKLEDAPCSIKLGPQLLQDIDTISKHENRTRSGTVRMALQNYVTSYVRRGLFKKSKRGGQ